MRLTLNDLSTWVALDSESNLNTLMHQLYACCSHCYPSDLTSNFYQLTQLTSSNIKASIREMNNIKWAKVTSICSRAIMAQTQLAELSLYPCYQVCCLVLDRCLSLKQDGQQRLQFQSCDLISNPSSSHFPNERKCKVPSVTGRYCKWNLSIVKEVPEAEMPSTMCKRIWMMYKNHFKS